MLMKGKPEKLPPMDWSLPPLSKGMKKLISGYLVVFTMLVGTLIGLQLVQQNQDIRQQAAITNGAVISFNTLSAAQRILIPGKESVTVPVSMDPRTYRVTATDITVNIAQPTPVLDRTNIVSAPTGFFDTSPHPTFGPRTTYTLIVTPAAGRIALGAPCDRCYLGPSPTPGGPTIRPCGSYDPACYPRPTNSPGIVANYTFSARYNSTGRAVLSFTPWNATAPTPSPPGTAVAAINSSPSDTDVTDTSTFTQQMGICVMYDFSTPKDGTTNGLDVARVSTLFNSHPGDGRYNVLYDLNNNGIGDGVINGIDVAMVSTRFNTSCTP